MESVWKKVLLDELREARAKVEMLEAMLQRGRLLGGDSKKKEEKK